MLFPLLILLVDPALLLPLFSFVVYEVVDCDVEFNCVLFRFASAAGTETFCRL